MSHTPLNLAAGDFDAYAVEKATSNAYSRPRLEVKQRALGWARHVVARLADLGIAVDVHASDEHPSLRNKKRVDCQWVFFWRDQAARDELDRLLDRGRSIAEELDDPSPYTRHAFLALRLSAGGVEVCFAVHPEARVDVDNLRARLGEEAAAAELMNALRALPEQFAAGVSPEDRVACSAITPEALRALVERAAAGQVPLWIGWSVSREAALEHSAGALGDAPGRAPTVDEQLEDAIIALAPIYRLVAWSRANDRIALDRRIETIEQERARAHAEAEAQNERWRAEQAEARRTAAEQARARAAAHEPFLTGPSPSRGTPPGPPSSRRTPPGPHTPGPQSSRGTPPGPQSSRGTPPGPRASPARPKPSLDTLFSPKPKADAPAKPATPAEKAEPPTPPPAPAAEEAPKPPSPRPPAAGPAASPPQPATIDKGVKVRVRSGPFADKVGVVGELDGRGGARVLLGLLSTRLEVADLEPVVEGRERPALQSSHRKPLAPPPRKAR